MRFLKLKKWDDAPAVIAQHKLIAIVILAASFIGTGHCHIALAKKAASNTVPGWTIRQTSNAGGPILSEVSRNAVKISLAKYGWVFIAKAPGWNLLFINDRTKKFVNLPPTQWKNKFLVLQVGKGEASNGKSALFSRCTGKTMTIANLKAIEYAVERETNSESDTGRERIAEVWTSPAVKAPLPVAEIVSKLIHLPDCQGIPLRAYVKSNGKMVSMLETIEIKEKSLLVSTFEPSQDWHEVHDQIAVMFGESSDSIANDLLDTDKSASELKLPGKI
jgi:hypothetical protein